MAAPIKPALKRALANDSWVFVPAIANPDSPVLAEVTAASGFNLSCSVFGEQEGFTATTEKVTLPRRNCESETFEVNGSTNYAAPDFLIAFDPQAAAGSDGKLAWETLEDMMEGFMVRRQGKDANTDIETGDFVDVVPVQLGVKVPTKTGTGADGVYAFTVGASITNTPSWNVAVVAA